MTPPVIELRGEIVDELRQAARQQQRLGTTSFTAQPRDTLKSRICGQWSQEMLCRYLCVDNPGTVLTHDNYADDEDVYGIQVRSTLHANGHLLTRDIDKPAPYVLVTLERVTFDHVRGTLRGWAYLHECNKPHRWQTHAPNGQPLTLPCYMTPQTALHHIDTVPITTQLRGQT